MPALMAWDMMGGGIDMALLPWVCDYLGIDDLDALMLDLITLRDDR